MSAIVQPSRIQKVLVIGATGYLGSHIVDALISHQFRVIGTVRKPEHADKLRTKYPDEENLAFVTLPDLTQQNALHPIMKFNPDIDYVIHAESPVLTGDTEKDIDRATRAMKNVITAIDRHGDAVETLVVTSSFAAMINDPPRFEDTTKIYSSRDVSQITKEQARSEAGWKAYIGVKSFAETACWKAYSDIFPIFALTTIALPMLFGPPIHDMQDMTTPSTTAFSSTPIINEQSTSSISNTDYLQDALLKFAYEMLDSPKDATVPALPVPFAIDVRDAAMAHVRALQIYPETDRWFIASSNVCSQQVLDVAREVIPGLAERLPQGTPGTAEDELDQQCAFDSSSADESAGIQYIPFSDSIRDTFQKLHNLKG